MKNFSAIILIANNTLYVFKAVSFYQKNSQRKFFRFLNEVVKAALRKRERITSVINPVTGDIGSPAMSGSQFHNVRYLTAILANEVKKVCSSGSTGTLFNKNPLPEYETAMEMQFVMAL
jgi:hypothetical protein